MAETRSLIVHRYWQESDQRFDYFITGVTGAMCAYLVQTMTIEPLACSPNTLQLVGLLVLVASTFFGIKRIEACVEALRMNFQILHHREVGAQAEQDGNREKARLNLERHNELIEAIQPISPRISRYTERRNITLLAGVLIIVAAKIWTAYHPAILGIAK